jgi:hypothetical protein
VLLVAVTLLFMAVAVAELLMLLVVLLVVAEPKALFKFTDNK